MIIPLDNSEKYYHSILSLIDRAKYKDYIHINYFVIRNDRRGMALLSTLFQALIRGVEVEILVDSYGSLHNQSDGTDYSAKAIPMELLSFFEEKGAKVKIFHPIKSTNKFNVRNLMNWKNFTQRNHNKLFVFNLKEDKECGVVVGDSQWANEHFSNTFRGNNCLIKDREIFVKAYAYGQSIINSVHVQNPERNILSNSKRLVIEHNLEFVFELLFIDKNWSENLPRFEADQMDFVFNELNFICPHSRKTIQDEEIRLMRSAKESVHYSTPYFGPDIDMMNAFCDTSTAVDLKILIAKFRSHPFLPYGTKLASKYLIESDVRMYEYNGSGNIHYKDLIVDDFSFIKSANGEGRSRFYNLESGVIIKSKNYAAYNRTHMSKDLSSSSPMDQNFNFIQENSILKKTLKNWLCPLYYHHL